MKIYADILILTNFIMTLVYLETLGKVTHKAIKPFRLFSASLCGGLFSLILAADANTFFSAVIITLVKFSGILLTLIIACKFSGIGQFFRYLLIYIAIRVVYTGMTLVYWQISDSKRIFVRNYTVYFDISPLKLILAVITAYGALTLYEMIMRKHFDKTVRYEAVYKSGNYEIRLPAVADSGNRLCDTFTGTPVVIFYCSEMFTYFGLEEAVSSGLSGFRLIPFSTVNGDGLIPVTSKGSVSIIDENGNVKEIRCCVGVVKADGKHSRAIFNPLLLR